MKILVDASIVSKGGGIQVALSIIKNIVLDCDFETICVVSPQIDNQLSQAIKSKADHYIVEKNESIFNKFKQGRRIKEIEKLHKPDFVFVVFGPSYWKPSTTCMQGFALGKMLYQQELNIGTVEKCLNVLKTYLFKWSLSYLVVETNLIKSKLVDYLNYSEEKVFVIGNSYSPFFEKCVKDNIKDLKNNSEFFKILVPGSYYPHKNLENVLYALHHYFLHNEPLVKVIFTIPFDSADWKKFYALVTELNLQDNIENFGFIPNSEFAKIYLSCDAILCASLVESSTAVFPEAFISHRPLLVSDRLFAHELCEDAAFYFDPLDPVEISNAMKEIKNNSSLREFLVNNGQKVLLKNYPSAETKWKMQKDLIIKLSSGK